MLDGKDIAGFPPEKYLFHTVFLSYALFLHMKMTENSEFSLKMPGKTPEEIKVNAAETSKEAELSQFADRYPMNYPTDKSN
ncbi:hypothetical protein [Nitrosomonas sp.]|uniref:hypothetical protein n=1 Tax=Nitrosomonas sp. TaxID=42353 RepID=UPI0025D6472A|nr:hypothetical protein [Nitrosomonas sp.]MBY0484740.1 hypothetical protein [Nitrosomonas sp.]